MATEFGDKSAIEISISINEGLTTVNCSASTPLKLNLLLTITWLLIADSSSVVKLVKL